MEMNLAPNYELAVNNSNYSIIKPMNNNRNTSILGAEYDLLISIM
jgi:hypothetical protein